MHSQQYQTQHGQQIQGSQHGSILQRLVGRWKEESDDNLDSFMKALDVNAVKRAVGDHTKFKEEWELHGNEVHLKSSNPFKSATSKFRLNETFEDDTMDGKKARTIYTEENGRLMSRQQREPHNVLQTREIQHDGRMVLTMTVDGPQPATARIVYGRDDKHGSHDSHSSQSQHTGVHRGGQSGQQGVHLQQHGVHAGQPGTTQPLHSVVQRLIGHWKEECDENLDVYMKELDVNAIKRAVGEHTKFKEEWEVHGDMIHCKMSNPFKSTTSKFRLNELFEDDTMDGRKAKVIYTEENGKLVCRQQRDPHNVVQCREIGPDGKMLLTMSIEGANAATARIRFVRNEKH